MRILTDAQFNCEVNRFVQKHSNSDGDDFC